nr:MAG: replication initiator protein [Microvirus sp.]
MVCYAPLQAWRQKNDTRLAFRRGPATFGEMIPLPCGQCIGCRIDRSSQWAMRCMNERRMWEKTHAGSFLTLTYRPEDLPPGGTLVKRDLQLFMKRIRNANGAGVRFYGVGEYGGIFGRPHYHVLLFNVGFADKAFYKSGKRDGETLYVSKSLAEMWPHGHSVFGDVTYDSCAYVSGYIIDKITGEKADDWYAGRQPEFSVMSKGIGASYYMKYAHEIYAHDSVIIKGAARRPPRYYDDKWKAVDSVGLKELKLKRRRFAKRLLMRSHPDFGVDRRRIREVVQLKKLAMKKGTS